MEELIKRYDAAGTTINEFIRSEENKDKRGDGYLHRLRPGVFLEGINSRNYITQYVQKRIQRKPKKKGKNE
jgi:hypothetical protein